MATFSQLGFEAERRRRMADALQAQNSGPVNSHLGGLAKVLSGALSGYQSKKADQAEEKARAARQEALSAALDPSRSREELPQILAQGGYEDAALKMATEKQEFKPLKDQAEAALFAQASGQQLSPDQTAALQAFDKLRQTEMMYDPRQNIVPKFGSLTGQQPSMQPAMQATPQAPIPQPSLQAPQGVLLPPPSGSGQPDASIFPAQGNATQMPSGLDPKAQGQYMDTLASQSAQMAAERAANGGVPKMTETQSQASSRATLMNQGLRGMSDALMSGNVSGLNMALADTAQNYGGPIGEYVANAQLRTPQEQAFSASKGAALEGIASAVTGAGVTQDQFSRFSNMLPTGNETPEVQRLKMANAYEFLLNQTKIAGPVAEEIRSEVERFRMAPAPVAPANGLTPEEQKELQELEKMFGGK